MTDILAALRIHNASIQNAVNFTLLLLTLMLGMYFGALSLEQAEIARAV